MRDTTRSTKNNGDIVWKANRAAKECEQPESVGWHCLWCQSLQGPDIECMGRGGAISTLETRRRWAEEVKGNGTHREKGRSWHIAVNITFNVKELVDMAMDWQSNQSGVIRLLIVAVIVG